MGRDQPIVECSFLVPLVQNSTQRPHQPLVWNALDDALYSRFGGSSAEQLYQAIRPVDGQYQGNEGERIRDRSLRYVVAIREGRLDELRALLRRVANSFDQECVYLAVRGVVEFVVGAPADGYLTDP